MFKYLYLNIHACLSMSRMLIFVFFICYLLYEYPLPFVSNYESIRFSSSKNFFPVSSFPSDFSFPPPPFLSSTQTNHSSASSPSNLPPSPLPLENSLTHTFFLGLKLSCDSFSSIPSLLSTLGGEVIEKYPSIRVFYIRVPLTVSLHNLNSLLPCLEYIEPPQQLEYQQFFGFGLGPGPGSGMGPVPRPGPGMGPVSGNSGSGSRGGLFSDLMGLGELSEFEKLAASAFLGEDFSSFGGSPTKPLNYRPLVPPSHQAPIPNPPITTGPASFYSSPYSKTYSLSSSSNTLTPTSTFKGVLSDISVPASTLTTASSSFNSNTFSKTSFNPIISTTTVTKSVISPTLLANNLTSSSTNGTNTTQASLSSMKYFDRNEWKDFIQNSTFPSSASNASFTSRFSNLTDSTNSSFLSLTSMRANELSKATNLTFSSSTIVKEGDLFVEKLIPQPDWPQGMDLWALDGLDGSFDGSYKYKYSGKGVHVYLVDSGVEFDHPGFEKGKVEIMYSSSGILANGTRDCTGHGSHTAGLVSGKVTGVAKDAYLHMLRVSGCEKEFTDKNILDALEYLSTKLQKPAVLSLTLLPLNSEVYQTSSLRNMLLRFINELQVPVIVPAGNRGTNKCSGFGETNGLISVGSHTRGLLQARFSNYGECSNIFAPGLNVWSHTNTIKSGPLYTNANGTSVSAPMTAGVVALMLEKEPTLSPIQIHQALLKLSSKTIKDNSNSEIPVLSIPLTSQSLESITQTTVSKNSKFMYWMIGGGAVGMIGLGCLVGGFLVYRKRTQFQHRNPPSTTYEYRPNSQAYSIQFTESEYSRSTDYYEASQDMEQGPDLEDTICEGRRSLNKGYDVQESYIRPPRHFAESVRNSN